jgi:tRNA-specific 2-thiouridylase
VKWCRILANKLEQKEGVQIDKDHSIYSVESQQELSSKESLVLKKKIALPLTWVLVGNIRVPITLPYWTKKGLNVGGTTEPLFIIATNVETNTIYTF